MQVIRLPRDVRVKKASTLDLSRSEYCHSARSNKWRLYLMFVSSAAVSLYVGSGGWKANLAAMGPGHGGQQNMQHNSLKLNILDFC